MSGSVAPAEDLAEALDTSLATMESLIHELSTKQEKLIENLEKQNDDVASNKAVQQVHRTMLRTHQYYKKLLGLRKEIMELHLRAAKLKKRAGGVEKMALEGLEERKKRAAREERLIAKPIR